MHRWPSEYRDPDGRVLDAPRDLGGHLEPGGSSHLVRVAVDRGGYAAGIATVGHVTRLRQRLGAMIRPRATLNEDGQRAQTQPCPRPGCGRPYPIRRYRYETLRQIGWPPFRVARYVDWCGHGQELIPVRDDGEWARLVPVIGTAK